MLRVVITVCTFLLLLFVQPKSIHSGCTTISSYLSDTAYLKGILIGKVAYEEDDNFVKVSKDFTDREIYLERQTYHAFKQMHEAALKDSINLMIVSGTRSFFHQRDIWEWKWERNRLEGNMEKALDILKYSSMPGTSRHHWGTDIDINSLKIKYFESGQGLKEFEWLSNNAYKFGFCNVLSDKAETDRTGYEDEYWHWSYLPVSAYYLRFYQLLVSYNEIAGFQGDNLTRDIDVFSNYVHGVNECN